jgi:hypothetical protein
MAALLCALTGGALLQTQAYAQDTYIWTFDHKTGETERFRTYIKITGKTADASGAIDLALKSASKHEYKDVSADGFAVFEQSDEKREIVFNGMPIAVKLEAAKPVTLTLGKNGIYTKRVNPNVDMATAYREKSLLALQSLPAPEKPVKVGDAWTTVMANPMLKGKMITATSTLVATEKVLGLDALKINLKMEFPSAIDAMENEIVKLEETYYLDAKTHQLLQARYTIKNPVMPFPVGKTEARVFVTRVVANVNEKEDPQEIKLIGVEKTDK